MATGNTKDAILKKGKTDDKRTQLFSSPLDLIADAGPKTNEKVVISKVTQKSTSEGKKSASKSPKPSTSRSDIMADERPIPRKDCGSSSTQSNDSARKDDISGIEKSLCQLTTHMTQMTQNMTQFMTEVRGQQAEMFECLTQNDEYYDESYEANPETEMEIEGQPDDVRPIQAINANVGPQQQMSLLFDKSDRQTSVAGPSQTTPNNDEGSENTLLSQLQEKYNKAEKLGPSINQELANIVTTMIDQGLDEGNVTELMEKYKRPKNCDSLTVSKINHELWDQIQPTTRSQDIKLQKVQATLIKSMIPIVSIANNILQVRAGQAQKLSDDDIFRLLTDSLSLAASTNQNITSRRREIIKTDLKDEYKSLCSNKLDETKFLFGEDLLQKVQNINTTNKVTNQLIQRPYGRGKHVNYYSGYGRGGRGRHTPYYHHDDVYAYKRGGIGRGRGAFLGRGRGRRPYQQHHKGKGLGKKSQQ